MGELEIFNDDELRRLRESAVSALKLAEETVVGLPIAERPMTRLLSIKELKERILGYEQELSRRGRRSVPAVEGPTPNAAGHPLRVFFSYAHADEIYRKSLELHLAPLYREGRIVSWHDRMIMPGQEWADEIDQNLMDADIILLLVSADFVASRYCYEREMTIALNRHSSRSAHVVPIFIRPADVSGLPFAKIQGLPSGAKPVSQWPDPDQAWSDVARGIRKLVEQ